MLFGLAILATALLLSVVAAYYSVAGLVAIFSAATIPVIIMGGSLELGKIVATVWLHNNWRRAPILFKLYLVPAVAFLMLLTSMGIFGYLSKAHSDQSLISGDATAKIAIYDEKIKTERDNIDANRKALKQLDEAVDQVMGRSSDERGAERSVQIRRSQQAERGRLLKEIEQSQKRITALNEERAPLAAEYRKVEAEVGPIKYIAALVYGDGTDQNTLEKAVRFVIIMIVLVFDPLALTLILAANKQFEWARQGTGGFVHDEEAPQPKYEPDDGPLTEEQIEQIKESVDPQPPGWMFDKFPYLQNGKAMFFDNMKPMVAQPEEPPRDEVAEQPVVEEPVWEDATITETPDVVDRPGDYVTPPNTTVEPDETPEMRAAMTRWKAENPNDTLKHQRWLLEIGSIKELPWMQYLGLQADNAPAKGTTTGFGTEFPANPQRGDTFVRVDRLPSVVYKFNGSAWMEVDKNLTDSYTYDTAYIDHLIEKIESGEYDPDMLSDTEREQVTSRLQGPK